MNILTFIRQVPDAEARVKTEGGAVDLSGTTMVIDGMDEYGVEEALKLRESGADIGEIIGLAVGPAHTEDALRTALAMGIDRAIHVEVDEYLDPIALSKIVAKVAEEENVELILAGGQQADWDSQALGAAAAERLGWPQVTWTSALELDGNTLSGTHDIDSGSENFKVDLPTVVTTQQGLNEPRYPTLPNIMKAKKKELRKDDLARFEVQPKVQLVSSEIQTRARKNQIIDGSDPTQAAQELLDLLRNDAKVLG